MNILLENGASIDISDLEGRTALRAAVFSGHEQIVKILIKHGADGNKTIHFLNTIFLYLY